MSSAYPAELKTLGDHIRTRRLDLGLRQSDVAKFLGAYTSTVNTWENGHFAPDVRFVPKIIEFLGYEPFGVSPTTFPARLKAARVAAGFTRRQLAERIRVHPGTVAEWERGEAHPSPVARARAEKFCDIVETGNESWRFKSRAADHRPPTGRTRPADGSSPTRKTGGRRGSILDADQGSKLEAD